MAKQLILVWNELQRRPATLYGDAQFGRGNYNIRVSRDPRRERKAARGTKPIIYNFGGSSGGGGGG
jgi:hypothetical protein